MPVATEGEIATRRPRRFTDTLARSSQVEPPCQKIIQNQRLADYCAVRMVSPFADAALGSGLQALEMAYEVLDPARHRAHVALGTAQFGGGFLPEPHAPDRHLAVEVTLQHVAAVDDPGQLVGREGAIALGQRGQVRERTAEAEGFWAIAQILRSSRAKLTEPFLVV